MTSFPPGPGAGADRIEATGHGSRQSAPQPEWHALAAVDVEARLESGAAGLRQDEAARRLEHHGPNRLAPPKRQGPLLRLLRQFHSVLIYVMLVASAITATL